MKVKYIKDGVSAKKGQIRTHRKAEARVLIQLGIVEPYTEPEQPAKQPARRTREPKKGEAFSKSNKVKANEDTESTEQKAQSK